MKNKKFTISLIIYILISIYNNSCDIFPDDKIQIFNNEEPNTVLSNIPPDDPNGENPYDPQITIYWYGYDRDGYIKGFKYRWCTVINSEDTLWNDWTYISSIDSSENINSNSYKKTFIFESPNDKNYHIFEVSAIDNNGKEDSSPARLRFWTKKGKDAKTELLSYPENEVLISDEINETSHSLTFIFKDKESLYAYKINDREWTNYCFNDTIILYGKDFPFTGDYKIYFKSRNKYYIEDNTPLEFDIKIIKPNKEKDILLIDMTSDGIGLPGNPTDEETDAFYESILKENNYTFDIWDVQKESRFPERNTLSKYKMIFIYSDHNYSTNDNKLFYDDINKISEYIKAGGILFLSCRTIYNLFFSNDQANTFCYEYFQIEKYNNTINTLTNNLLKNSEGYPLLQIDSTKIPFDWNGGINNIQVFKTRSFCKRLYYIDSVFDINTTNGILKTKYYKTILSTLPLYYYRQEDIKKLFKLIFENIIK